MVIRRGLFSLISFKSYHFAFFTDPCGEPGLCSHPYHQCKVVGGKALCLCPMVITANLDPVCGSDGQTYPNPSALESMSCLANRIVEDEYRGECVGMYLL